MAFKETHVKKIANAIIAYLSSLTFTVILLAALSVTVSIAIMEGEISAVIQRNQIWKGTIFNNLFRLFGFNDLYNSFWFLSLLILFYLNLLLCTLRRVPKTLKVLDLFNNRTTQQVPSNPGLKETLILSSINPDFIGQVRSLLSATISDPSIYYKTRLAVLFAQKGRYAQLGFYLAHGGLLFLLMGGLFSTSSYEGNLYLREGETVDTFFVKKGQEQCVKKLDFVLRLDSCSKTSSGKNSPLAQRNTISFLQSGAVQKTEFLEGYGTATYKGVRIALSSSREDSDYLALLATTPKRPNSTTRVKSLKPHQFFRVPETGHLIRIKNIFSPSLSTLQKYPLKKPVTLSQNSKSPLSTYMLTLEVYGEGNKLLYSPAVFSRESSYQQPWDEDYNFSLLDIKKMDPSIKGTSLKLSFEPGGRLIWTGLVMAIFGFSMMFCLSHRKLWVKVEERSGDYHLTLAGWSSGNPETLKDCFKKIKELAHIPLSLSLSTPRKGKI
jgi:cytochrome c biogenesis protein